MTNDLNDWQKTEHDYKIANHEMAMILAGLAMVTGYFQDLVIREPTEKNRDQWTRVQESFDRFQKEFMDHK